jgi:TPR repeat protein
VQGSLGAAYEFGWGVQVNIAQAVKYYKAAAADGDTTAMVALGKLAEQGHAGEALPRDAVEALR